MKRVSSSSISRKTVARRLQALLVLFIAAASLSYPAPANWLISQISGITHISLPQIQKPFVLGLDLQGGTSLEYEADVSKVAPADQKDAMAGVRDVIERRVNTLGVSEPVVQTTQAGASWRVNVELAGINDVNQAIKLIGETPILEFKEPNDQKPRDLTADEKKLLSQKNDDEQKQAEAIYAQVKKDPSSFDTAATSTDLGYINSAEVPQGSGLDAIVEEAKKVPAGTILDGVWPTTANFDIVKVQDFKQDGDEVHARHILISYAGAQGGIVTTSTKEEALAKIKDIQKQVTMDNFSAMAEKYSEEPGANNTGGDLGYFSKGIMVQEFEDEVFPQATGTISDIVETPFGYHLIQKVDQRPNMVPHLRVIQIKRTVETDIVPAVEPWKSTGLTGKQLSRATVDFDQRLGSVQVALQFNDEGAKLFQEITKRNIGQQIAIFLDGNVISAPVVNQEIVGGQAVITGNYSVDEAKTLARRLQAGALPVPIKLIAQQSVGPTLGADSLDRSLKAGIAGFILVALFMILLYRIPGFMAIVALGVYAAISAAIFKLVPITLTLAGIAGFVLSLGIAVDANVLVYERLKEELRAGKALGPAMEEAFKRAWPSIRDGHVTVLISCVVLFWFSSSIIKGFSLTLAAGMLTSLFTAVIVARNLLRWVISTPIGKWKWGFLASDNADKK